MGRVTKVRRGVQILFFIFIVYGGFLFGPALDRQQGEIVTDAGYAGSFERGHGIRWVQREKVALDLPLPATSCYYQHKGFFWGCSVLFLSEHLMHLTPLFHLLPPLLFLLALMFVFGRLFCGWVCPFGLLSDLLTWLRKQLGRDHFLLSRGLRDALVWTKYLLLLATLGLSLLAALPALAGVKRSLMHPFCQICPGKFASPFLSFATICWTNFADWITTTLSILGLVTFVFFFLGFGLRRAYCRICPVGGLSAPFNRFGLVSLHKEARHCTRCGACARVCPVDNLTVYEGRQGETVNACECILCLRCVEICPEKGCLQFTLIGRPLVRS